MDLIGSIDRSLLKKAMVLTAADDKSSQAVNATPEALAREEGYRQSLDVLRQLGKSSVSTILFMEHYFIANELEQTKNPYKAASLLKAVEQIDAAREMLTLTEDPSAYKKMIKLLPPHEKEKDLPRDTVIRFFDSHKKRLKNFITYASNESDGQQAILSQRLVNIKRAEGSYVQIQHQILGDDWRPPTDTSRPVLPSAS